MQANAADRGSLKQFQHYNYDEGLIAGLQAESVLVVVSINMCGNMNIMKG